MEKETNVDVLIDRIEAYLSITGKSKSGFSRELGYSNGYIKNVMGEKKISVAASNYIEMKIKEIGLEEIDAEVERIKEEKIRIQEQQQLFKEEQSVTSFPTVGDAIQPLLEKIIAQLSDVYAMELTNNSKVTELVENNICESKGSIYIDFAEEDEKYVRAIASRLGFSVSELVSRAVYMYWLYIRKIVDKPNFTLPKYGYFRDFKEFD